MGSDSGELMSFKQNILTNLLSPSLELERGVPIGGQFFEFVTSFETHQI